jgi:hypothetical protein
MPVGIDGLLLAGAVEFSDLIGSQIPAFGGQILAKLLFVSSADNDRRDGRALQKPVQSNLRNGFAGLFGDRVQSVDDVVKVLVGDLRTLLAVFYAGGWFPAVAGRGGSCR